MGARSSSCGPSSRGSAEMEASSAKISEIRQHGGVAGAQKWRDHARKRQRAEHAGADQHHFVGDEAGESQPEEEAEWVAARTAARSARETRNAKSRKTEPRRGSPILRRWRAEPDRYCRRESSPDRPSRGRSRTGRRWRAPTGRAPVDRRRERRCPTARATCRCARPRCAAGPCGSPTATEATISARPASARPGRPRATANMERNTKNVTSAGPRSFSSKNIPNAKASGAQHRNHMLEARQPDALEEFGQHAFFAQIAEPLPVAREVSGEEQHQQNLDRFHRLERAEVHLRIVARRGRGRISCSKPKSASAANSGV